MELISTKNTDVSDMKKRISGLVRYDDGFEEEYWYEYPSSYSVSQSGNPWLVALLPVAATIGEDIRLSLPVDPRLLDGAKDILRIWSSWYPSMHEILIIPENRTKTIDTTPSGSAAFFSSGIDAFYTVYKKPRAKFRILIHGFDLSISKQKAFNEHCDRISKITDELGDALVPVATNLRQTRWNQALWQQVSHGSALASIALLFERHFKEVFIPSSHGNYARLGSWGSHPLSDPLFSTSKTSLIHDGDGINRFDKTLFLGQYDLVLRNLHVCIRGKDAKGQDETNCSHCEKCYRTMIALELDNKLDQSILFDKSKFNIADIKFAYVTNKGTETDYVIMETYAKEKGRDDIADGIRKCIRRSKVITLLTHLENTPLLWRIPARLIRNSIY